MNGDMTILHQRVRRALACAAVALAAPAHAQEQPAKEPRRVQVALGPQLQPGFPGAKRLSVAPFVNVWTARGDAPFEFEAPDENLSFPVVRLGDVAIGPALNFMGSRTAKDVGTNLPRVGFTVEAGGFAQILVAKDFRVRAELRQGIGGHKGLVGNISADFVARDGDASVFSIGPRLTVVDRKYQAAYFAVAPADAAASGLAPYAAKSGIQSAGAAVGYLKQISPRWGLYSYAKYERLLGNAASSPIVRSFGSRDQFSVGLAATYTFSIKR